MASVEPLLTTLYSAEKVAFELESMSVQRLQDTIIQDLVIEKEYENSIAAAKDRDKLPGDEPMVSADITLRAIEWLGFPKDPKEKPAETKEKK